jgi:hypothetical protein
MLEFQESDPAMWRLRTAAAHLSLVSRAPFKLGTADTVIKIVIVF